MDPGSWKLGSGSRILDPASQVLDPGSKILEAKGQLLVLPSLCLVCSGMSWHVLATSARTIPNMLQRCENIPEQTNQGLAGGSLTHCSFSIGNGERPHPLQFLIGPVWHAPERCQTSISSLNGTPACSIQDPMSMSHDPGSGMMGSEVPGLRMQHPGSSAGSQIQDPVA